MFLQDTINEFITISRNKSYLRLILYFYLTLILQIQIFNKKYLYTQDGPSQLNNLIIDGIYS